MTKREFATQYGIRIRSESVDHNPNMDDEKWSAEADHWRVTLFFSAGRGNVGANRSLSVTYSKGSGHHGAEPTVEEVLDSLASDASSYDNSRGFEDWADDLGFEWDPSCADRGMTPARANDFGLDCDGYYKAKKTYKAVESEAKRLKSFLGEALYRELLETESD